MRPAALPSIPVFGAALRALAVCDFFVSLCALRAVLFPIKPSSMASNSPVSLSAWFIPIQLLARRAQRRHNNPHARSAFPASALLALRRRPATNAVTALSTTLSGLLFGILSIRLYHAFLYLRRRARWNNLAVLRIGITHMNVPPRHTCSRLSSAGCGVSSCNSPRARSRAIARVSSVSRSSFSLSLRAFSA